MIIKKVNDGLYSIDLRQKKPGYRNFISPWIYKDEELCFLVDPGPTNTINTLKDNLHELDINLFLGKRMKHLDKQD